MVTKTTKIALATAGALTLIIASFSIIPFGRKDITPTITPTPTPSVTPSPTPTPTPTPVPVPVPPRGSYAIEPYKWDLKRYPRGIDFIINPTYPVKTLKIPEELVINAVQGGLDAWDRAINKTVYNHTLTVDYNATTRDCQDSKNVITWGPISKSNTVAVATMWYTQKEYLVETDIVFNTKYMWGVDPDGEGPLLLNPTTMDIQNIGTHELGHCLGLDDIYDPQFRNLTMYGNAECQETYKISLAPGDIYGARCIYT